MTTLLLQLVAFSVQVVAIFFLSRVTINQLYRFFRIFIKNDKAIFTLISLIYLPGTIIHEFSHFVTVIILFMKVREFTIIPQFQDNYIKLGSVIYEKKDPFRSIIVGLAPFFIILTCFWAAAILITFPTYNIVFDALLLYMVFVVSSSMFSSEKDLQDLVYLIPLLILIVGVIYVFDININILLEDQAVQSIGLFFQKINTFLLYSFLINIILIFMLKIFRYIMKK